MSGLPLPAGELTATAGSHHELGARVVPGGIAFAVRSAGATAVSLVLFRRGAGHPFTEIPFPVESRIGGVYAMTVRGLEPDDFEYGYRVHGPVEPAAGDRFEPGRILTDPYGRAVAGGERWGGPREPFEGFRYRSRVVPDEVFDWAGDRPLGLPLRDLVIYESHVRGFTRHPSLGVVSPGTYAGMAETIGHLTALGVNCVELLPVFEFDELANDRVDPVEGRPLWNYWGYNTVGFFAPKTGYAAATGDGGRAELKSLVKQLHGAGIEVVLDVVFNHTAEGDHNGPAISFRGLDNSIFYLLDDAGGYRNYSGTGNSVNANHPVVIEFILDCLRFWVTEYHVDGFRFDLASVLTRDERGTPLADPPLLRAIAADPLLRDTKLIAEAWDAAGLYQVGSFPAYGRWSEWNGQYRDVVRRFLKGDEGMAGSLAQCLIGSPDLYRARGPVASVNFVTAHDGFTLADLVSYNEKHNERNGEHNQDGEQANHSWNCGIEGPTDDVEVRALRDRQARNALALLLLSHGVPMLTAGDEMGRTQRGNNNAYCQDGELSWVDWDLAAKHHDLIAFTRDLIAFRRAHPVLRRESFVSAVDGPAPEVSWHGRQVGRPDFSAGSRLVAMLLRVPGDVVYLAANAHWEPAELELPEPPGGRLWRLFADTSASPGQISRSPGAEPVLARQDRITAGPRSVLVLTATVRYEGEGEPR